MTDLSRTIVDIARTLSGLGPVPVVTNDRGPNNWEEVTAKDFGPRHDFEVDDQGTIFILNPISEAALQWCYYHLPADAPRWGSVAYMIEHRYIEDIVRGCRRDGLLSEDDYVEAMEQVELENAQGAEQ
jgi:hypothetical protein